MNPRVSVIMPLYNAEKHLREAIDSILNQTFNDFEFIIIDDCSTDGTAAILDSYEDTRIIRLRNSQNLGIVGALNRGLDAARGDYIARMDGDDISLPARFQEQVAYFDAHPEVGLLGTKYIYIDEQGQFLYNGIEAPPEPDTRGSVKWALLWKTAIQHPSAMIRREILEKHQLRYEMEFFTAEDYELWARIGHHAVVERLPGVYLYYRSNPHGISSTKREQQMKTHYRITYRELCCLIEEPLPDDLTRFLFNAIIPDALPEMSEKVDLVAVVDLLARIREKFLATTILLPDERQHIQHELTRAFLKILAYAREQADSKTRFQVRLRILQKSPDFFVRLSRSFVQHRLKQITNFFK